MANLLFDIGRLFVKSPPRPRRGRHSYDVSTHCEALEVRTLMSAGSVSSLPMIDGGISIALGPVLPAVPARAAATTTGPATTISSHLTATSTAIHATSSTGALGGDSTSMMRALAISSSAGSVVSVVSIENRSQGTINYSLQWPGTSMQSFTVPAGTTRWHWVGGSRVNATISFDKSYLPGYQEQRYTLPSLDFFGSQPQLRDAKPYCFSPAANGTGVDLHSVQPQPTPSGPAPLDRTRLAQYRQGLEWSPSFPNLGTNFEVMDVSTSRYNCIAHSLGIHDRWVNPITTAGSNPLSGMDGLYRAQGYQRMSGLDFSLQPGFQKVVVYATTQSNGTIKEVTHGALQSADGSWTSKLGQLALIRHLTPDVLNGPAYGRPVAVYIRKV